MYPEHFKYERERERERIQYSFLCNKNTSNPNDLKKKQQI